jgi:N-methylhydantoinase B
VSGNIAGAVWEVEMAATAALSKLAACSDTYLREAQAAPAGRPGGGGSSFSGVNQHGEHFTNSGLVSGLATGAGAYSHQDGIWTQGQHNIERTIVSNCEAMELDLPLLYLWHGLAADGGGAGRRRGGLSTGSVYKPHKTAGIEARYGGASWDVPDSAGIFGGYLGALADRVVARRSNVEQLMVEGHVPAFDDLQGEVIRTPGMPLTTTTVGPDDVFVAASPAGGGWGDPLDRPVEEVQADLEFEAITPGAAQTIYGVVLHEDGRVDQGATRARRAAIRAERRDWPARRVPGHAAPAGHLHRVCPLGDQLEVVTDSQKRHWTRCTCGHVLAPAAANWREYAGYNVADPSEIAPSLRVNSALEIRRYSCPGCGRIHSVDLCRKGAPDPHDVRLLLPA